LQLPGHLMHKTCKLVLLRILAEWMRSNPLQVLLFNQPPAAHPSVMPTALV